MPVFPATAVTIYDGLVSEYGETGAYGYDYEKFNLSTCGLTHFPNYTDELKVYVNGQIQYDGTDYTFVDNDIDTSKYITFLWDIAEASSRIRIEFTPRSD